MTEHESKTQKNLFKLVWALIALFTFSGFVSIALGIFLPSTTKDVETIMNTRTQIVYDKFLIGLEINEALSKNRDLYFNTIGFYTNITRNVEIAKTIIDVSLTKEVPINLAFAIAWQESRFDSEVVNENKNNTKDQGLFQINEHYHPNVDAFDIQESTEYALDYLLEQYQKFYDWNIAGMLYNAGTVQNISEHSLRYFASFLEKEKEFDEEFNSFRRNLNLSNI